MSINNLQETYIERKTHVGSHCVVRKCLDLSTDSPLIWPKRVYINFFISEPTLLPLIPETSKQICICTVERVCIRTATRGPLCDFKMWRCHYSKGEAIDAYGIYKCRYQVTYLGVTDHILIKFKHRIESCCLPMNDALFECPKS